MLHHIRTGPRPPTTEEPVDLLMACHARLRHFSGLALSLAAGSGLGAEPVRDASTQLVRYFRVALPLHEADEEQSLAPALLSTGAGAQVAEALERMTAQHVLVHEVLEELLPEWERLQEAPEGIAALDLLAASRRLGAVLDIHLALEEQDLFPVVEVEIPVAERRRLFAVMRARRTPEVFAALDGVIPHDSAG